MRATRAKPRLAVALRAAQLQHLHSAFLGIQYRQLRVHAGLGVAVNAHFCQALGNRPGDQRRRQIGVGTQQSIGAGIGHGPLTPAAVSAVCGAADFVELAQHMGAHIGAPVVQLFFELVFDDLALFFNHQNFLQARGKFARELGFQGPDHADLVQPHANALASGVIEPQVQQSLAGVVKGFATGHQTKAVVGAFDHVVVQAISADVRQRRIPLGVKQARFLV